MAKKKKVNLRQILNDGTGVLINESAEKETDLAKKLNSLTQYLVLEKGADIGLDMRDIYKADVHQMSEDIPLYKEKHRTSLVNEVRKDTVAVGKKVTEPYALDALEDVIGGQEYQILRKAVGERKNVREAFGIKYNDSDWKRLTSTANQSAVENAAERSVKRDREKYMIDAAFIADKKNKTPKYSATKFGATMEANANKAPNKETKEFLYEKVGLAYAHTEIAKAKQNN
jgi:hypothetical protein